MMGQKPNFKGLNLKVFSQLAGGRDAVCYSLSGDTLKMVYGRATTSGMELVDLLSVEINSSSDEDISQAIKAFLEKLKLKSPEVINVIPANFAITKDIEIPSLSHSEIWEILNLQASRHTPYSQEEIIIDYVKIGTYKESYTKLIFVIIPLSMVRRQIAVLAKTSAKIERILFAPEAMGKACSQIFDLTTKDSVKTIIHIDAKFTDFMNVLTGKLIYVRCIPIGTQHLIGESERYQGRFIEEIKKSIEAYQSKNIDRDSEEYILTGALAGVPPLQDALSQALGRPVKTLSYWERLTLTSDRIRNTLSLAKESFLDLICAMMTMSELKVNLIPEEIRLRKSFEQKSKDLVGMGISVMIFLALLCAIFMSQIYFKTAYLKNLTQKYQSKMQVSKELQEDFSRMEEIKNYLKDRETPFTVLTELYDLVPADVRLTTIKYGGQGKFSIEGNSRAMATVFSLITAMEQSPYFMKAESKRTTKRTEGSEEVVDFEIVCMLEEKAGKNK